MNHRIAKIFFTLLFLFLSTQSTWAGSITGTVTNLSGVPVSAIKVTAYDWNGIFFTQITTADTNSSGVYLLDGLSAGDFYLQFSDDQGVYATEGYDNEPHFSYGIDGKTVVTVVDGQTTSGINAELEKRGSIGGRVTNLSGAPLEGIYVSVKYTWQYGANHSIASTYTDSNGEYVIDKLVADSYYLSFIDLDSEYYAMGYPDEVPLQKTQQGTKSAIQVTNEQDLTNYDVQLGTGGQIHGLVQNENNDPLEDVSVSAYLWNGSSFLLEAEVQSDNLGQYQITGLPTGTYYLNYWTSSNSYIVQGYPSERPFNFNKIGDKTGVDVIAAQTTSGINANLQTPGKITGTITDNGGNGLAGIYVAAFRWEGGILNHFTHDETNNLGEYTINGLVSDDYYLYIYDAPYLVHATHVAEWYHDDFTNDLSTISGKTPVSVIAGQTATNIDEQLSDRGVVTGRVTNTQGQGIEGIRVSAYSWSNQAMIFNFKHSALTNANGEYTIIGLEDGEYYLIFTDDNHQYVEEAYHDEYFPDLLSVDNKTPVQVVHNQETSGIDEQMELGGSISGTVHDLNGNPIQSIRGTLSLRKDGRFKQIKHVLTGSDGSYQFSALPSGTYYLHFYDLAQIYETKGYPDESPLNTEEIGEKLPLVLTTSATITDINIQLGQRGNIYGQVTNQSNQGIYGVQVDACVWEGDQFNCVKPTFSDPNGNYYLTDLVPGEYYIKFGDYRNSQYIDAAYQNESPFDWTSKDFKTPVILSPGETINDIDMQLIKGAEINGRVIDQSSSPISSIKVSACLWEQAQFRCVNSTVTDSNGQYSLSGLLSGNYYIVFGGKYFISNKPYVEQAYGGEVPFDWSTNANKTAVGVALGEVKSGIDAQMTQGGYIQGHVTDTLSNNLNNINVQACLWNGSQFNCSYEKLTGFLGTYKLGPMLPGDYYVRFGDENSRLYQQKGYPDELPFNATSVGSKTPITVIADNSMTNIDAQLDLAADIVVVSASSILETAEVQTSVDFTVFLNKQPSDSVNLSLNTTDSSEGTSDIQGVEFTPGNWNQGQTIRVTGSDDNILDGAQKYQIELHQVTSNDTRYHNLAPKTITVINDDDEAGGQSALFIAQTDVTPNARIYSNVLKITGIEDGTRIKVSNGFYQLNDSKLWLAGNGLINNGDFVMLYHNASHQFSTSVESHLTIADTQYIFKSTTKSSPTSSGGAGGVPPPIPTPGGESSIIDGVEVKQETNLVGGKTYQGLTIEPISSSRTEDGNSESELADIPLLPSRSPGQDSQLIARLPVGVGLKVTGTQQPQSSTEAKDEFKTFVQAIQSENKDVEMEAAGEKFINDIAGGNELIVSNIDFSIADNKQPEKPILIEGKPATDNFVEVVLIDASSLPPGTKLELKDVEFAIVIGNVEVTGGIGPNIVFAGSGNQLIILGEDNDELHGGEGDDTVGSEGGDDKIFGDEGNDTLFGGEGDDFIHGGSGKDIALYNEKMSAYSVLQKYSIVSVTSKNDSSNTDTLVNVETLSFSDQSIDLAYDEKLVKIATFYQQVFSRQADLAGFQYWADKTLQENSLKSIVLNFLWSEEAKELYQINMATADDDSIVNFVYQALLKRAPDDEGKVYWKGRLETGDNPEVIIEDIMYSAEFKRYYADKESWNFADDGDYRGQEISGGEAIPK